MKFQNWDTLTQEQKQFAVSEELRLVTHNGTTREDLLNCLRFQAAENAALNGQIKQACASAREHCNKTVRAEKERNAAIALHKDCANELDRMRKESDTLKKALELAKSDLKKMVGCQACALGCKCEFMRTRPCPDWQWQAQEQEGQE